MKEKVTIRHAVSSHLRGIKELHKVSPKFFPLLTLHCFFSAIFPYISVFFSAQILTELATLRRADILWKWVIAGALCVGVVSILKAFLQRRYNTLLNDCLLYTSDAADDLLCVDLGCRRLLKKKNV